MSCSLHTPLANAERTPLQVNGTEISHAAISAEVQNHRADSPTAAWKAAARALVVREVLLHEAHRKNMIAGPSHDEGGRRESEDEALMRQLIEAEVQVPSPTSVECRHYYDNNMRRFRSPDVYEASHILLSASKVDTETYDKQFQLAMKLIEILKHKPHHFVELARLHSDCSSAEHGGNLGQVSSGQTTPEFEAALQKMRSGDLSLEPVVSRYGHHVIYLERKIAGAVLPFNHVQERIAEFLSDRTQRFASAQYIARLVAKANVSGVDMPTREDLRVF
ncbi:MAG: peptidylprolyl isomerase [Hyphomicrobiaceae bacterium]